MIIEGGEYDRDDIDLLIIGGGPAGLTAGIYAKRALLKVVLLERSSPGGKATLTHRIDNYPGFPEGVGGMELSTLFLRQAQRFTLPIETEGVVKVEREGDLFRVTGEEGEYMARSVIVATGTREKRLGVPGEEEFTGRGVSYCATCDAPFFREKDVAVVGGGDTAIKEAIYLSRFAGSVTVIHRREGFRAEPIEVKEARENRSIRWKLNCVVTAIKGEKGIEKVVVRDLKRDVGEELKVQGVFVFIGSVPETEFLKGLLKRDDKGFIETGPDLATSVEGIFAAGDVRSGSVKQVVAAAGEGALAFNSAYEYLKGKFRDI